MERAIASGVDYLASRAGEAGWLGFPTLAGRSDEWVTAFILAHTWRQGRTRKAFTRAARALADAPHARGGWAYGSDVPEDADSTIWALAALGGRRLLPPEAKRRAHEALRRHVRPDGVATYLADSGIADYVGLPSGTLTGWTSTHPDVTAAALAGALPVDQSSADLLASLVGRQDRAGWWSAYWWRGPHYTTALTLRALDRFGMALSAEATARLRAALERERLDDGGYPLGAGLSGDPFTSALAAESTIRIGADARAAVTFLLDAQRSDGSWPGSAGMRIPAPPVTDPADVTVWHESGGGGNSFVADTEGLFATALACHSLWLSQSHQAQADRRSLPSQPRRDDPDVALVQVTAAVS